METSEKLKRQIPVLYKDREHMDKVESHLGAALASAMQVENWQNPKQMKLRSQMLKTLEQLEEMRR